jgi:dihydrofolate reductase
VDEFRLMVFPIVLGEGKRLFLEEMVDPATLQLVEANTAGSGVLLLRYHPATYSGLHGSPSLV